MPVKVIEKLGLKKRYQALPKDTNGTLQPSASGMFNQSENTLVEGDRADSSSVPSLAPPLPMLKDGEVPKNLTAEQASNPVNENLRISADLTLGTAPVS